MFQVMQVRLEPPIGDGYEMTIEASLVLPPLVSSHQNDTVTLRIESEGQTPHLTTDVKPQLLHV